MWPALSLVTSTPPMLISYFVAALAIMATITMRHRVKILFSIKVISFLINEFLFDY